MAVVVVVNYCVVCNAMPIDILFFLLTLSWLLTCVLVCYLRYFGSLCNIRFNFYFQVVLQDFLQRGNKKGKNILHVVEAFNIHFLSNQTYYRSKTILFARISFFYSEYYYVLYVRILSHIAVKHTLIDCLCIAICLPLPQCSSLPCVSIIKCFEIVCYYRI